MSLSPRSILQGPGAFHTKLHQSSYQSILVDARFLSDFNLAFSSFLFSSKFSPILKTDSKSCILFSRVNMRIRLSTVVECPCSMRLTVDTLKPTSLPNAFWVRLC